MGVVVIGAGGHGRIAVAALRASGRAVLGVLDDGPFAAGELVAGAPILGPTDGLASLNRPAHLAIGDNGKRREAAQRLSPHDWTVIIHPAATVDEGASVQPGAFIGAGAVVQVNAVIGSHAVVNTGAIVEHDCRVGGFAHLAPGARLAGGVTVGEGALVGLGACVLAGVRIGQAAVVGAGAVVIGDVAAGATVAGVPARRLR